MSCSSTGLKDLWWSSSYSPLTYKTGRDIMDLNVESFEKVTGMCCALDYNDNLQYSSKDLRAIDKSQRKMLPKMLTLPRDWVDAFPAKFVVFLKCALDTGGEYFGFNLIEVMRQVTVLRCTEAPTLINPITQRPFTASNLELFKKKFKQAYKSAFANIKMHVADVVSKPKVVVGLAGPIIKFVVPFGSYGWMLDFVSSAVSVAVNNSRMIYGGHMQPNDYRRVFGEFVGAMVSKSFKVNDLGFPSSDGTYTETIARKSLNIAYKWVIGKMTNVSSKAAMLKVLEVASGAKPKFSVRMYKELYKEEVKRAQLLPLDRGALFHQHVPGCYWHAQSLHDHPGPGPGKSLARDRRYHL